MRLSICAATLLLAACASTAPTLDERLASWNGASVQKFAEELDVPAIKTDDIWEWRITQNAAATSRSSTLGRSTGVRCSHCDANSQPSGYSASPMNSISQSGFGSSGRHQSVCAYRATIDDDTIVELEAFRIAGRCRFDEVGLNHEN